MFEFRKAQKTALIQILTAIKQGKTDIFVQAPTGTGKSLIALELAKILHERKGWKAFVLTSEKLLQAQYERDCEIKYDGRYSNAASISGVDNYDCHINGEKFSLGHCKAMGLSNRQALELPCSGQCEYLQRWQRAQASPAAIFNYAYFLLQMNYVLEKLDESAPFQPRPVVICDEAHCLPDVIEDHFACYVDQSFPYKIREVQALLDRDNIKTEFGHISSLQYSRQIERILKLPLSDNAAHLQGLVDLFTQTYSIKAKCIRTKEALASKFKIQLPEGKDTSAYIKASQDLMARVPKSVLAFFKVADDIKDYNCKLEDYIKIIRDQGLNNMVVEATETKRTYHNLADHKLHRDHFVKFSQVRIYLSATLQPENLIERWDLAPEGVEVIVLNSGWDPGLSPVKLTKTANFRHDNSDEAIKLATVEVDRILERHKGQRGIIHTTSYKVTQAILQDSKYANRLINYQGTQQKMELLEDINGLAEDAVIIGPSLVQGIDLPDDLARFNVIVKLSYPDVSSRLWSARLTLKKGVYLAETANRLEQSSGRSTRHAGDTSVTYILDSRAEKFIFSPLTRKYLSHEFISRVIAGEG